MKRNSLLAPVAAAALFLFTACNNAAPGSGEPADTASATLMEEAMPVKLDSISMLNIVAFTSDTSAKKPIVLIVPEWWGMDEYIRSRAAQLAQLGYFAVGVDIYGNGKTGADPAQAGALAGPFYANPAMALARLQAALDAAKVHPHADSTRTAAIGYCFGGAMVLNTAKLGLPVNGVVSFHGGLAGVPPVKELLKAQILVCHGGADPFVPAAEVTTFKKQLDSLGIAYSFKEYANATHAFTNPKATEKGKQFNLPIAYNATADSASWSDMRIFLDEVLK